MAFDLSGFWDGFYRYPRGLAAPVPFEAVLTHGADALSGVVTEPNRFSRAETALLSAVVRGTVEGRQVAFDKTYDGRGASHAVAYQGRVTDQATLIAGTWRLAGLTGGFEMRRSLEEARSTRSRETAAAARVRARGR